MAMAKVGEILYTGAVSLCTVLIFYFISCGYVGIWNLVVGVKWTLKEEVMVSFVVVLVLAPLPTLLLRYSIVSYATTYPILIHIYCGISM